ncbi:hypothetical protein JOF56_008518 [Kibdelosporangium banguiense]|uniref:Uncharacterized protein n=1 Tax=Kibdelosporangium banguiense TaxID=1365924 RepID=A0ABS4TVY9_9PSEU|nr:hypothetical protein [Kibdelosporangium banguiense]MBP2328133.1 hypothetical protein [Kibdelosporangium banguiense]
MSIHEAPVNDCLQVSPHQAADTAPAHGAVMTTTAGKVTAILRITTGLVFLWAFLDKTFGLGLDACSSGAKYSKLSLFNAIASRR